MRLQKPCPIHRGTFLLNGLTQTHIARAWFDSLLKQEVMGLWDSRKVRDDDRRSRCNL